jgi:lincosamide nucleotidyltransferase A/C/D/E
MNHQMVLQDVQQLVARLQERGVDFAVGGGWAVDALLGNQTREHSDLDLWVRAEDLHDVLTVLVQEGIDRILPWPGDRPWNWVVHDGRRKVDLHLFERTTAAGDWRYGGALYSETFPEEALQGQGTFGDLSVRCESARWSLEFHNSQNPRDVDVRDMRLLCQHFGLDLPTRPGQPPGGDR